MRLAERTGLEPATPGVFTHSARSSRHVADRRIMVRLDLNRGNVRQGAHRQKRRAGLWDFARSSPENSREKAGWLGSRWDFARPSFHEVKPEDWTEKVYKPDIQGKWDQKPGF
jgi:hypothetical protein